MDIDIDRARIINLIRILNLPNINFHMHQWFSVYGANIVDFSLYQPIQSESTAFHGIHTHSAVGGSVAGHMHIAGLINIIEHNKVSCIPAFIKVGQHIAPYNSSRVVCQLIGEYVDCSRRYDKMSVTITDVIARLNMMVQAKRIHLRDDEIIVSPPDIYNLSISFGDIIC